MNLRGWPRGGSQLPELHKLSCPQPRTHFATARRRSLNADRDKLSLQSCEPYKWSCHTSLPTPPPNLFLDSIAGSTRSSSLGTVSLPSFPAPSLLSSSPPPSSSSSVTGWAHDQKHIRIVFAGKSDTLASTVLAWPILSTSQITVQRVQAAKQVFAEGLPGKVRPVTDLHPVGQAD